jgi:hypothetical protein
VKGDYAMKPDLNALTNELVEKAQLSLKWMKSQIAEDGTLAFCENDLGCYYKCVYPLRIGGYPELASSVLNKILELHATEDGDLRNSPERRTSGTYTSKYCQIYPNGWIILGAYFQGRFDVFRHLMDGAVKNLYDPQMGTFYASAFPKNELYDVNSAAMATELFALCDIPKARKAADFLIRHIESQPDPDQWYYSVVDKQFRYVTDLKPNELFYTAVKKGEKNQAFWFFGMPCAALLQLYELTGESKYLEAARKYFDEFLSCGEPAFCGAGSGKAFWSSSILYRLTGEKKYLDSCIRLMDFFFGIQQPDGTFLLSGMTQKDMVPKFMFDTIPEYARWFLEVAAELSGVVGK